jgi:pimeloyl-ACP methyl ester carboxylesterase
VTKVWGLLAILVGASSVAVEAGHEAPPAAPFTLRECRLEHPLRIGSLSARCGRLEVAEDPQHPSGEHIALNVAVVPALNRRSSAAPLFILAGGPGQGAIAMYAATAGAFALINRDHDIVLVDQRGTGGSAALVCDFPEDWQQPADPMPALRQATAACLQKFGPRVRFYTTAMAVQDLERVRGVLGYEAIDLYAASYGTRVAQSYMRRHGARVHAAILDGVTYPEQVIGPDTPLDGERALQLIVARCMGTPACSAAFPALQRDLDGLRHRYGTQRTGLTLTDPNSGLPQQFDFDRGILNAALRFLSYNSTQAALLPVLVHNAAGGTLAPLAAQTVMSSRQVGDQLASGMQYSVICSEDVPFYTTAGVDADAVARTYQGADQLDALAEICKLWPRGPVDPDLHAPLHSDVPTLLLSGTADPVTPPQDAERAALGLTHHRHLVLEGEGHGQLATACVPRLMSQFLDLADPERLDASCLRGHVAASFFVSMTGPRP